MIQHDALINILRAHGFTFKRATPRVEIYKKKGSTARVEIGRRDLHDDDAARSILRRAGLPANKIDGFILGYTTGRH